MTSTPGPRRAVVAGNSTPSSAPSTSSGSTSPMNRRVTCQFSGGTKRTPRWSLRGSAISSSATSSGGQTAMNRRGMHPIQPRSRNGHLTFSATSPRPRFVFTSASYGPLVPQTKGTPCPSASSQEWSRSAPSPASRRSPAPPPMPAAAPCRSTPSRARPTPLPTTPPTRGSSPPATASTTSPPRPTSTSTSARTGTT